MPNEEESFRGIENMGVVEYRRSHGPRQEQTVSHQLLPDNGDDRLLQNSYLGKAQKSLTQRKISNGAPPRIAHDDHAADDRTNSSQRRNPGIPSLQNNVSAQ